jgi:integrase
MNAATTKPKSLRVYKNGASWYWVVPHTKKWIRLTKIVEGETAMLARLSLERKKHEMPEGTGDAGRLIERYILEKEAEHQREHGWTRIGRYARNALRNADVKDIDAPVVNQVLKFWKGKVAMQRQVKSFISGFFQWCILEDIAKTNPCRDVKLSTPKARTVYIPDDHFLRIRAALSTFEYERDGVKKASGRTASGAMMQCFVDLCYLTAQRSTEIRLLKWSQVDRAAGVIHFLPTKTKDSSGLAVDFRITPEIEEVLERVRAIDHATRIGDAPVIHNLKGGSYNSTAFLAAWDRAAKRAGLGAEPYTIKDIRAKALTDAKKAGYDIKELMVAAAHSREQTTQIYMKKREIPVSEVRLHVPKSA